MCGRFTLTDPDPRLLRFRFDLREAVEIGEEPRFNIAPTDPVLAVRCDRESDERQAGPALRGPG
jgi:putative SOS response-associated peptidase YedK